MFCSIMDAVRYHALHTPEKLCVADGIADYSYLTMYEKAGAVATYLQNAGVKQGDRVTVECTQNAYYLICGLACQLLGAIFVPVENKVAIERLKEITTSVEAALHIGQTEYQTDNQFLDINVLFENLPADADMDGFSSYRDESAIAEILYTTGTTGKPKGIMISNGNNVAVAENILYGTEMKKDSVELIPLPLSHSHGLRSYYAHLINGSSVVLADGVLKVKEIFELMDKYQVTALDLSPSAAKILLKLSKGNFSNYSDKIDYVQIGTAMLGEDVKEDMCRIFSKSRLYNCYGSTESGRSCILDFNHMRGYSNCIGRPSKNARFVITGENREVIESSKDNMGLVAVAGPMNMQGYWRDEATTSTVKQGEFIYTNDIGYIDEEGLVYVLGRADDVINYQGIKIAPEDIEQGAMKFAGILDCACVPMADKICGQVPKLFIVVEDPENFQRKELVEFLSTELEANKMPKKIELIDSIPRTANGKVQRKKLIVEE